ncbi:MAG: S8 family serine peptidase, partial [Actinomycetota bacterium]|nr:S8 family serine peptidase [Actinomycetota bacterium]
MTASTARRRSAVLVAGVCTIASAGLVSPSPASARTAAQTYIVVLETGASDASGLVKNAGGSMVANWSPISVVLARSSSSTFASKLKSNPNVLGVRATGSLGSRLMQDEGAPDGPSPVPAPTSDSEPLAGWQWDMTQINAFAAHEINAGSPDVVVADVDTGLDFTHPDLAPNYDASLSRDCTSGSPVALAVGNDANGHGTHTAGTIGAAVNGIGITGVAPNVRLAGLKAGNNDGYFFPEAVICAYMWIGSHGIDVANNSYFVDPWLYNCRNDADQRAIWNAVRRAISFAQSKGTVVVASEGNDSTDLSHPSVDPISPDTDPQPVPREVTNACAVIPVEIPGVVGV